MDCVVATFSELCLGQLAQVELFSKEWADAVVVAVPANQPELDAKGLDTRAAEVDWVVNGEQTVGASSLVVAILLS